MRRRRFMAPAVVAMLFVNTIIQNAPAEQTIETEAQEKEVKVNSQTTPAAQSLEEAKANLDQAKKNTRQAQSAMEKADQEVKTHRKSRPMQRWHKRKQYKRKQQQKKQWSRDFLRTRCNLKANCRQQMMRNRQRS